MGPDDTVDTRVSEVELTFSKLVNLNTFTPSAIMLVGPGGVIAVDQPQFISGTTYEIGFAARRAGHYTLTITPTVTDLAGNEIDQNQNGMSGEPSDSFTGSFTIALPDLAVTATQAPSTVHVGASIPVSWTVTNESSTNSALSIWTDSVYISKDSTLGSSADQLISVPAPDPPLEPLASYTQNESITIPETLVTGDYYLLFVANSNGGQFESDSADDTNAIVAVPVALYNFARPASRRIDRQSDDAGVRRRPHHRLVRRQ